MDVDAGDGNCGQVGGEGFVFDPGFGLAVERVGAGGVDLLDVHLVAPASDLLVTCEHDAERPVLDSRVGHQVRGRGHDRGDAGLVVRAEQGGSVGGDERLALEFGHPLGLVDADDLALVAGQDNVFAVVFAVDHGLDVFARGLGRRVHVCEPGDGRGSLDVARYGAHHDAVRVDTDVFELKCAHLVGEDFAQLELPGRTRIVGGLLDRGGFHLHITQESIQ